MKFIIQIRSDLELNERNTLYNTVYNKILWGGVLLRARFRGKFIVTGVMYIRKKNI